MGASRLFFKTAELLDITTSRVWGFQFLLACLYRTTNNDTPIIPSAFKNSMEKWTVWKNTPTIKIPTNILMQCPRIIKIPISMIFLVLNFFNKLWIIFQIIPEHYWQWCLIDCHTSFTLILKTEKRQRHLKYLSVMTVFRSTLSFREYRVGLSKKRISEKYM